MPASVLPFVPDTWKLSGVFASPSIASGARRSALGAILVAGVASGAVTAVAALPVAASTTTAALLYVVAVMGAAVAAGFWAGLGASVLSFLALNFFFTPPLHTLSVGKLEDLVALLVFLIVSATVGALLSSALAQRARAERREREATMLHHLSARMLAGEPTDAVLESVARGMKDLFDLAGCEITATPSQPADGPTRRAEAELFSMTASGREEGRIEVVTGPARAALADHEREVIRTFAGQIGLALAAVRLGREAESARVEADANRARAALFSSVSHDLRTPLSSITASATSLLGDDANFDPGDRRDLLDTIRQEAERLNRLVGNFLHLSRMRAGGLDPVKTLAAIDEVIEGVTARLEPALAGHPVRLLLRENLPEIPMDVTQIDQLLTNVLENAAKFSPPRSEIVVSAVRWQDAVEVRVADRGIGIPPADRIQVFEPFYRAAGDSGPGTGLGLAIAKAIVEVHRGKIWVEGAPAGGTTVVFQLPVKDRG